MKNQGFYQDHLSTLFTLFGHAKTRGDVGVEDTVSRDAMFWLQNLMSEADIPRDFKLAMIEKASEAGVPCPGWLHP